MTLFWQPGFVMQICSLTGLCSTACLSPPGEKGKPCLEPPSINGEGRFGEQSGLLSLIRFSIVFLLLSPVLEAQVDSGCPQIPGGSW